MTINFHGLNARLSLFFLSCSSMASLAQEEPNVKPTITDEKPPATDFYRLDSKTLTALTASLSANAKLEAEKEQAIDAKKKADDNAAIAKSGRLIQSGVTAGVGVSIVLPLPFATTNGTDELPAFTDLPATLDAVGLGVMPYAVVLPAYWSQSSAKRAYCASHFGGGDEATATQAAGAMARRRARVTVDTIALQLAAGVDKKKILSFYSNGQYGDQISATLLDTIESHPKDDATLDAVAAAFSVAEWDPSIADGCGWNKWGAWLGAPAAITGIATSLQEVTSGRPEAANRDVDFVAAIGVAFVPNANISILGGVGWGTLTQKTGDDGGGLNVPVTTLVISVGGNFDAVAALANAASGG